MGTSSFLLCNLPHLICLQGRDEYRHQFDHNIGVGNLNPVCPAPSPHPPTDSLWHSNTKMETMALIPCGFGVTIPASTAACRRWS